MSIHGETLWITGATSGIGLALVEQLAEHNHVIASGRNAAVLESLNSRFPKLNALPCDLTTTTEKQLTEKLQQLTPYLDRIILCAGNCEYLNIELPEWHIHRTIMDINFHGAVTAVAAALPLLKAAQHGHIVGVTSLATQAPFPKAEAYGASKAALSYFLGALRMDVARFNIDVTDILPGFIDTPLTQQNNFDMPFIMSAETAAQRMVSAIVKRPYRYVFPKRLYALFKLLSWFQRWWVKHNNATLQAGSNSMSNKPVGKGHSL